MAVAVKKSLAGKNGQRIMDNKVKKVDTLTPHGRKTFFTAAEGRHLTPHRNKTQRSAKRKVHTELIFGVSRVPRSESIFVSRARS